MKSFKEDQWVTFYSPGHPWHLMQFRAYPSKYTPGSYRLKYGDRELLADESELRDTSETSSLMRNEYEESNSNISRDAGSTGLCKGPGSSCED